MTVRELPQPGNVYRSLGQRSPWDRLGCGVIDKSGWRSDLDDYSAPTWSLIYLLQGSGVYRTAEGESWDLHPGDCFARMPGIAHSTTPDPASGWWETFIDLGPTLAVGLLDGGILQRQPLVWTWGLSGERIQRFVVLRAALAAADEADLPAIAARIIALATLATGARTASARTADPGDDPITAACRHLAESCTEREDLRTWCAQQHLDYDRFRKRFRQRMGMPPGEYRLRRRMDRACALLQASTDTIADIAVQLGYPSPYEFSAQFRQRMGLTPSAYRRRG
jgi:AraC family transcriptional regulator of arabinose operon